MSLPEKYAAEIGQFVEVTNRLAANKYVTGYGGNAAWKLDDDLIPISAPGVYESLVELYS